MRVLFIFLASASLLCDARLFEDNEGPEIEDIDDISQDDYSQNDDGIMKDLQEIKPKSIDDVPGLTEDMLIEAIKEAKQETKEEEERTPREKKKIIQSHYRRFIPELEPARIGAIVMEKTTRNLASKLGLNLKEAARTLEGLQSNHLKQLHRGVEEKDEVVADKEYLTSDENTGNDNEGGPRTPFRRLIPSAYADDISAPRRARNNNSLPNARLVSSVVFQQRNSPINSKKMSHMAMIWGQFLDHDIALGAQPDVNCSSRNCELSGECFGIPIPVDDIPFRSKNKTCIQFKRDIPAAGTGQMKPREQVNVISSFIDASQIYSDDPNVTKELSLPGTPFLREMKNPAGPTFKNLLPKQVGGFCQSENVITMPCFKAGDVRTNENAGLASMHTVWLREHNRIATELKKLNPSWDVNRVFREARKIVVAMLQHITFNEFLPLILNKQTRRQFNLLVEEEKKKEEEEGFYRGYNPTMKATISNAFAAAAYRFGHSLVQNQMNRFNDKYKEILPSIEMNRFLDPTPLYETKKGGVDSILRGFAKDKSQKVDRFFAKAIQEQLVRDSGDLSDLPALNIQRGREHGIPGYNAFREWAGLGNVSSFKQLMPSIPKKEVNILAQVYTHPDDIDLFVGGLYETPLPGAVLGRIFSFILAEQFQRLRHGDPSWYERPGMFSLDQLTEIGKVSLAKVICRNGDDIHSIQKRVLESQKKRDRKRCSHLEIDQINLDLWQQSVFS